MTITSTSSRMPPYAGNGSATAFPVTIPFPDADCLRAILCRPGLPDADLVRDTDFTLAGAGDPAGGTLVFPKAGSAYGVLAPGQTLHILRVLSLTQERDWDNVDALDAEQIEAGDDRLTMICQQLQEQLDRALQWPATAIAPDTAPHAFVASAQAAQALAESAQDAAVSARTGAEAARDAAQAAAATVNLPAMGAGDAGKLLEVNGSGDGYQFVAPSATAAAGSIALRDASGNLAATLFNGTATSARLA